MLTYLFYDIETTGLSHVFDQILQFAAIRTDVDLHELARYTINIRLRPDVVLSPQALLTHRISIPRATAAEAVCEYEAMCQIHKLVNTPGTLSIGYNSLGYDDVFLRFAFYRNLLPPYTHQYVNGCGRADVYPMTIAYWLLHSDILHWPRSANGQVSLRLANLQAQNQLSAGAAHDAVVDTRVTLALARRFQAVYPEVWLDLLARFNKQSDLAQIQHLPVPEGLARGYRMGMMINGRFGYAQRCIAPVLQLVGKLPGSSDGIWLRLDQDLGALADAMAEGNFSKVKTVKKKLGGAKLILPLAQLRVHLDAEREALLVRNLAWLSQHSQVLRRLAVQHHAPDYADRVVDADAALYTLGFETSPEAALHQEFHDAPVAQKARYLADFQHPVRQELAIRLLARNYPEHLPESYRHIYQTYAARLAGDAPMPNYTQNPTQQRTTPPSALADIAALLSDSTCAVEDRALLEELARYITHTFVAMPAK